jgi:hypothetical protein
VAPSRSAARSLIPALLAVALSAVLVIAILLRAVAVAAVPALVDAAVGVGVAGLLVIAGAVATARTAAIGWGVALLAAAYAACVVGRGAPVDVLAPLVGLLLVLVAELSHTACEWRGPHATDVAVERRRWARLTLTAAAGAAAGAGALALATAVPGSVLGLVVGATALVGLVGLAAWLRGGAAGPVQPVP